MDEYKNKAQNYYETPRKEMLEFIPQGVESVLEVGCGTGAFGAVVKQQRNCKYVGIEFMADMAEQAKDKLDEVIVANIETSELALDENSFDCLVCNDVLEHLVDPWATLTKLCRYVKPGGYVVLSLPNVRFSEVVKDLVFRKKWEYQQQGVLDRTHLRFFTKSSIRELVESAGLSVIKLEGINGIKYAWRLQLLNLLLLGGLNDMRYMQYGCLSQLPSKLTAI